MTNEVSLPRRHSRLTNKERPSTDARIPRSLRPRKKQNYHHGNLRETLIECGLHLLDSEGREAMSLRSAARMAGVSQTAPKNHFRDKEGLLAAIAARGFQLLTESRVKGNVSGTATPEVKLRRMVNGYVEFALARPALFDLMFGPVIKDKSQYPELDAAAQRSYQFLSGVVAEFMLERRKNPGLSAESQSFVIWGAMHGLATLLIQQPRARRYQKGKSPRELCDQLSNFVVRALLAPV